VNFSTAGSSQPAVEERIILTTNGIQRTSPPQAVQKVREGVFMVQVGISGSPSADWRRLFYDAQQEVTADFPPRSVEISGNFLRFKSDPSSVEQKIRVLDRWMERASQKEASMGGRSEGQRQKKEELEREAVELAEWNTRWAKL
jgi:hypothetical protein